MRGAAVLAGILGLILSGLCLWQWNAHTETNIVHGLSAYNAGDKPGLLALDGESSLNDTARTGIEGFTGAFWMGVGVFLWRKDVKARVGQASRRDAPRLRR